MCSTVGLPSSYQFTYLLKSMSSFYTKNTGINVHEIAQQTLSHSPAVIIPPVNLVLFFPRIKHSAVLLKIELYKNTEKP